MLRWAVPLFEKFKFEKRSPTGGASRKKEAKIG
jgi:hypothetical protein